MGDLVGWGGVFSAILILAGMLFSFASIETNNMRIKRASIYFNVVGFTGLSFSFAFMIILSH